MLRERVGGTRFLPNESPEEVLLPIDQVDFDRHLNARNRRLAANQTSSSNVTNLAAVAEGRQYS